jgi:UDP-N-acetylglucosamine 2-epimerase (non-hydrolysing)/GDP/UDP-N,N'-diacetylbacillosamine 2-epimerase (hydrolysing)
VRPSLEALEILARQGYQVVLTYPNNDAGGRRIIQELQALEARHVPGIQLVSSLGRHRFHGVLNLIGRHGRGAFVGNSSAGIKETPAFGCPTVNIGSRQQGRLRANNVLDAAYDRDAIVGAIRRCAEDEAFRLQCQTCDNPYGAGNAGPRIADTLATMPIDGRLLQKKLTY